jgi:hypothetical protein
MKITVDLEDLWADEENISDTVKNEIIYSVKKGIIEHYEKKTVDYIERAVKLELDKTLNLKLSSYVDEQIEVGKIKSLKSNEQITLKEFVREKFEQTSGWNSWDDKIKAVANSHSQDMKNRYDLLFASQLVAKMQEAGMLKEDVAKLLLEKK